MQYFLKIKINAKIFNEQNIKIVSKDRISITDFPLCLRFQYGLAGPWFTGSQF